MTGPTRRELVLQLLTANVNQWVDGPRIASPEVGGSEGLKRVRELRQEGYDIRMRKHPDRRRDIFQYRLVHADMSPIRGALNAAPTAPPTPAPPASAPTPGLAGRNFPLTRNDDGSIEIVWQVCAHCGGRYAIEADHRYEEIHRAWAQRHMTLDGHTAEEKIPPQPQIYSYSKMPDRPQFGESVVCPRCKGFRHKHKGKLDDLCTDPSHPNELCHRCNGFGIVPNIGPVPRVEVKPEVAAAVVEAESETLEQDG